MTLFEDREHLKKITSTLIKAASNIGIILLLLIVCAISNPASMFSSKAVTPQNLLPVAVNTPMVFGTALMQDAYLATHLNSPLNEYLATHSLITELQKKSAAPAKDIESDSKTSWIIDEDGEQQFRIDLRTIKNSDDISVVVNKHEVIRLRENTADGLTPMEQALTFAQRLSSFVAKSGDAEGIKLGVNNSIDNETKKTTIVAGTLPLLTVDQKMAKSVLGKHRKLAFVWTNQIRKALGVDRYIDPILAEQGKSQYEDVNPADLIATGSTFEGQASWYGPNFHGKTAADGSIYNMHELTAAHKTLPFGTMVRVTNKKSGKSAIVRITDRGPYAHGRVIDLSKAAAKQVDMLGSGVANVSVEVLDKKTDIIAQQKKPVAEGLNATPVNVPIPVSSPVTNGERLKEETQEPEITINTEHLEAKKSKLSTSEIIEPSINVTDDSNESKAPSEPIEESTP